MKILFVCENYYPHYGGAEVLFRNLAEGFVKRGHQVTVLTHQLRGTKRREMLNDVAIERIPSFHSRYAFSFLAIPKAIALARKHDIIQTTTFNGAPPAWLAGKLTKKPVVLTVHEVWIGKWKEITGFSWLKSRIHDVLERGIYLLPFDKYICVSDATKRDLLRAGINENKVERIYNGFDYGFWNPRNFPDRKVDEIKEKLGLNGRYVYFSWGRPGPSKGFEYIIKAVPLIRKRIPKSLFLLMLSSADTYKKSYTRLVERVKSIPDGVRIIPSVPYAELGNYIKAADCVVVPSVSEGFGYAALEGIAMKKPLVVSDAGSLPEVVGGRYQMFENKNVADLADKAVKIVKGEYVKNRAGGPPVTDGRHVRFAHRQPIFEHTGIPQMISGLQSKPPLIEWWNSSCLKKKEMRFEWEECVKKYMGTYFWLLQKK